MKKYLSLIMIVILILVITVGCVNVTNTGVLPNGSETSDQNKKGANVTSSNNMTIIPTKKVVFNEAFSGDIIKNPKAFLEKLISGFNIGMSEELVKQSLGEPTDIRVTQGPWGEESNLIYEDVQEYQITLKIVDNKVMNFEVGRYLNSTGKIPVLVNKYKPQPSEPLYYKELGFEGVILGLRVDEVLNRFGDPLKGYLTYDEMYGYDLAMVYKGATIHIILGADNPYVQFIETNNLGIVSTYRNISVGSSIEEVITSYGQPDDVWETSDFLIYSTQDYWYAIKFEIKENQVKRISIYNAS